MIFAPDNLSCCSARLYASRWTRLSSGAPRGKGHGVRWSRDQLDTGYGANATHIAHNPEALHRMYGRSEKMPTLSCGTGRNVLALDDVQRGQRCRRRDGCAP